MHFLHLIQANSLTSSVRPGLEFDFAAEPCVDEDNIADSEDHAAKPPGETDREGVRAGGGLGEGDVAIGASGGRKERGIKSPAGTREPRESRPVRSELKLHRNPRDDAEHEVDAKDAAPEARGAIPFLVARLKRDGLENYDEKSKAHGELGKQIVKGNGESKMKAVNQLSGRRDSC